MQRTNREWRHHSSPHFHFGSMIIIWKCWSRKKRLDDIFGHLRYGTQKVCVSGRLNLNLNRGIWVISSTRDPFSESDSPLPTSPIFWTRSLAQFFGTLFRPFSPRPISWRWSPNSGLVLPKWWLWWPNFFDLFSGPYFGPHSWPHLLDPFPGGGIVGWCSPNGGSGGPQSPNWRPPLLSSHPQLPALARLSPFNKKSPKSAP